MKHPEAEERNNQLKVMKSFTAAMLYWTFEQSDTHEMLEMCPILQINIS